jgi:DNA polymerase III subunit beta
MKVTISRDAILSHLQRTQYIVERKSTLPILSHILMETLPSALRLSSTDLEVGVTDICDCQVHKQGRTTIHARKFFEIIRELPVAEIQLSQKEENLEIRSGRSLFRLRSLSPDEFPRIPQIQTEETVRLPAGVLREMITRVAISISSDDARYTLTGVLTQMEEREGKSLFRMVTTDGHRLSFCERELPVGHCLSCFQVASDKGEKRDVILPKKAVQEMGRLVEGGEEGQELEFGVFQENAFVRKDNFSMVMRLVQGKFPDHKAVIPTQIERNCRVESVKLEEALRRVSLLSTEKTRGVRFSVDTGKIVISSNSPEIGEAQEEIDVSYQGDPFEVSFNVRYILDLVQIIHGEIVLEFGPGLRPCMIKELSDPQHLYIVMPLRT